MKNMNRALIRTVLILTIAGIIGCGSANRNFISLSLQSRGRETNKIIVKSEEINPVETAIIVIDMWDDHHCIQAAKRVAEMAPAMNEVLKIAHRKGVLILHSPSSCMEFYKDTPQRLRARKAPFVKTSVEFKMNDFNPVKEGYLEPKLVRAGCSCDTPEPCRPEFKAWNCEIETIKIGKEDAISDEGQEIHNLLQQQRIKNVIIMGVHTNRCVLRRPFGIRQMVYLGKNVILCRDLTDSYHRDPGKHFEGLKKIIAHIERYWCPTITSDQITGGSPFRFKNDKTK